MRSVSICISACALLLIAASSSGCGRSCTLMYVPSYVSVSFDGVGLQEPGRYEIELAEVDGFAVAMCVVDRFEEEYGSVTCTPSTSLQLTVDGPTSMQAVGFTPEAFDLIVLRDGVELAVEGFEPIYSKTQPNGPGCGVTRTASVTMDVEGV